MYCPLLRLTALAAVLAVCGALTGCGGAGAAADSTSRVRPDAPTQEPKATPVVAEYVPNQVLVRFSPGISLEARKEALFAVEGKIEEHVLTKAMEAVGDPGFFVVQVPGDVYQSIQKLANVVVIELAEPNFIVHHTATSNDPYYTNGSLWGMYGDATSPTNQFGSQAGEAWANNRIGITSVHVAVIDEGVMHGHTDLSGQVWVNPYDPVDGIDNDGNGYVDDRNGWDFDGNNNTVYDGASDDHGTHVAGTIGAKGGNGTGVVGVVWNTRIIVCKFLGNRGGTTSNAIKSLDYVTDLKNRHGIDLVASNSSWGGGGFSQLLKDAIDRQGAASIVTVCAAGNSGANNDSSPFYPASYTSSNIVAVASLDSNGAKSSFSNYGATSVDIGAPGRGIVSTVPARNGSSSYASYSGTSMAAPHVTGGLALLAASSSARGLALRDALLAAGVPTASMANITVTGDRLDVSGF